MSQRVAFLSRRDALLALAALGAGWLLLEPLRRTAAARSLPIAWANTTIQLAQLGDNAIALGAVSTVLDAAFGVSTAMHTSPMRAVAARAAVP